MPEANQYTFTNKELLTLLVKAAGVREGRWMLQANFGLSAGNFGPTPDQTKLGALMVVNHMGIQRAAENTPKELSVDAADVNAASST